MNTKRTLQGAIVIGGIYTQNVPIAIILQASAVPSNDLDSVNREGLEST